MNDAEGYLNTLKDLTQYVIYDKDTKLDMKKLDKMIDKVKDDKLDKLLKKKGDNDE